ncbi:hypothetical protein COY87_03150 [Candidatus Roizmanbacteria bacterium CG_4_10_14_0_8_um_filter_33_9]|uniref:DNA polymerase III delta N-terminal domain-containing protein n=1 Tax=Candidatus Roizmanbacteria bacterium CG_4_10_14_0_8_um_filter_33_9 TaxID=1974826 RepID=A0A2M7QIA1_9BACT|nr:MAG: hypothetical protein COY87_03150 [Candidatus Roizmanbacteria bacterium CG_4_10_14_0_8_um_filter_33_9]
MLTIICGEDTIKSREYYTSLKNSYIQKGYQIQSVQPSQIEEIQLWIGESQNLFFDKHVFFVENLESRIIRSRGKKSIKPKKNNTKTIEDIVIDLTNNKTIDLIDWEEGKQAREIKLKNLVEIKEFKLTTSIFKLQDALYPSNLTNFIQILNSVASYQDAQFIFLMLARFTRSLILAQDNLFTKTTQQWQQYKLKKQAFLWSKTKLIGWYEGMFRIDLTMKTGSNPFGIIKSLEILACHYL